jgi:hypothetical protein
MRTRSILTILLLVAVFVVTGVYTASACQKMAPPSGKSSHMQTQCAGGQKAACDPAMCAKLGCDPAKCGQMGACDPAKCAACPSKGQCKAGQKCTPGACKGAAACGKSQAGTQQLHSGSQH